MSTVRNPAWLDNGGREAAQARAAHYRRQGFAVELIEVHNERGQLQSRFLRVAG